MIVNEIELKRKTLLTMAKRYGLTSVETIRCSQELDVLLLQQIKKINTEKKTKQLDIR
ncbi:aspartyl-phosphate phosphatase Spo0E family protein [Metabacillus litoralis]|uniref:aspartyl-phosphate phosphatase Spo0E family protein n=1 Tax=Metabacillus litoralis TaxID=152268 RepID=UPI0021F568B8|nr:aspartyl-phosphate phosphatase Spo0E family protein [Metabacillus litoralis]